jgi:hypothetical protein
MLSIAGRSQPQSLGTPLTTSGDQTHLSAALLHLVWLGDLEDEPTHLLVVLKPNRIIRKCTDANYSSFHLRVFLGLLNPRDRGRLALYLYRVITLVKEKLSLTW